MKTKKLTKKQEEKLERRLVKIIGKAMSDMEELTTKTTHAIDPLYPAFVAMLYVSSGVREMLGEKEFKKFLKNEIL